MQLLGNVARLALIGAALIAAAASASSTKNSPAVASNSGPAAPPPVQMDPSVSLGLWQSSFGAVKIEINDQGGANAIHGVWVYDREGQQVIGYFGGTLRGNVLDFAWQEPGSDGVPLTGGGYLVFETSGARFTGHWWTASRDRTGEWTGWRQEPAPPAYGGAAYGGGVGNPF